MSVAFPVFDVVGLLSAFCFVVWLSDFFFEACLPAFFFSVDLSVLLTVFSFFIVLSADEPFFLASLFVLLSELLALLSSVVAGLSVAVVASEVTSEGASIQKGETKMLTLKDLNTTQTWNFENKTDASDFISTMSFGFEWQLINNNTNEVIACHYYE